MNRCFLERDAKGKLKLNLAPSAETGVGNHPKFAVVVIGIWIDELRRIGEIEELGTELSVDPAL